MFVWGRASFFALAMRPREGLNKVSSFRVDPLVNGLIVGGWDVFFLSPDSTCNDLRSPSHDQVFRHVGPCFFGFETFSYVTVL